MGKTTNILDLNNRLEKVEKEKVAQNSYTSLKNKPKINNVTLTGNKTLADIGAAAAADVGDKTLLNTTVKSSTVAAINEVNSNISNLHIVHDVLCNVKNIPETAASYDCNWSLYDFIIIYAMQYNNALGSVIIDTTYFAETDLNKRPFVKGFDENKYAIYDSKYEVYKNDNSHVFIKGLQKADNSLGVKIIGVKLGY